MTTINKIFLEWIIDSIHLTDLYEDYFLREIGKELNSINKTYGKKHDITTQDADEYVIQLCRHLISIDCNCKDEIEKLCINIYNNLHDSSINHHSISDVIMGI